MHFSSCILWLNISSELLTCRWQCCTTAPVATSTSPSRTLLMTRACWFTAPSLWGETGSQNSLSLFVINPFFNTSRATETSEWRCWQQEQEVSPGCGTECFCLSNRSSVAPRVAVQTESGSRSDRRGCTLSQQREQSTHEDLKGDETCRTYDITASSEPIRVE